MASCDIQVKEIEGNIVYLKGRITGLDRNEQHCLYFKQGSAWVNLNSQLYPYVFFSGATTFNLDGCWAPRQGNSLQVKCMKVSGNCETGQQYRCSGTIDTSDTPPPAPRKWLTVIARDPGHNPVSGVSIKVDGSTKGSTGSDGSLSCVLDANQSYRITGTAPSGYSCIDCSETVVITNDDVLVNFSIEESGSPPPSADVQLTVRVSERDAGRKAGVRITKDGREIGYTGTGGTLGMWVKPDTCYLIGIIPPNGFRCDHCEEQVCVGGTSRAVFFTVIKEAGEEETCVVEFRVNNQFDSSVDATVTITDPATGDVFTERLRTDPYVQFTLKQGTQYNVATTSDGCTTVRESLTTPNEAYFSRSVRMTCEAPAVWAYISCYTKCLDGTYHSGIKVTCDAAGETKDTNSSGRTSFRVRHGKPYVITMVPPDGHTCDCPFCICSQSGTADKDYDPKLPFRYAVTEEPEPEGWTITAPSAVSAEERFDVRMTGAPASKNPNDLIQIKTVRAWWFDSVIGSGIADVDGHGTIECSIPEGGAYQIYAYYPGSLIPGGQRSDNTLDIAVEGGTAPTEEQACIVDVRYPDKARTGDEFVVEVTAENTGTEECELRAYLIDVDRNATINKEPDLHVKVPVGGTTEISLPTAWHYGAMPDHDWDLRVELKEIDKWKQTVQKTHAVQNFTVTHTTETPPSVEFTLDVPSCALAGDIAFSGKAPAGAEVLIKATNTWFGVDLLAGDEEITRVIAGPDGTYSGTMSLDSFGSVQVYGQIKKGGLFDWLVRDLYTEKHTVYVITTVVIAALLIAILLVVEKKYTVVGLFKKRR